MLKSLRLLRLIELFTIQNKKFQVYLTLKEHNTSNSSAQQVSALACLRQVQFSTLFCQERQSINSTDFNPMNYYFWDNDVSATYRPAHTTKSVLPTTNRTHNTHYDRIVLTRAGGRLSGDQGNYFQYIYNQKHEAACNLT